MKLKICTLLIAFVALFLVFAGTSCEKAQAGERAAVSEKRSEITLQPTIQVVSDQTAAADVHLEIAWVPHRAVKEAAMPATASVANTCYEEESDEEWFGYQYTFADLRTKPPSFSGLGGDHFARADV